MITNGTFTTNTTGWSNHSNYPSAVLSIDTNRLKILGGGAQQSFSTVIGKTYVLTYTLTAFNPGGSYLGTAATGNAAFSYFTTGSQATGTYVYYFTAVSTTTYITLFAWNAGTQYAFYDDVSVRLTELDRSVNNQGLGVYGTIAKSAVSPGANLVAYSGFSSSNYLQQPYNSALDFGTGPFSMTIWCKSPAGAGTYVLYSWRGSSGTLPLWQTYFGDNLTVFDIQDSSSNNGGFSINRSLKDNVWHLLTVVQRNSSLREFYIDGILVGTNTTTIVSLTSTAHELRVGTHYDGLYAYNGSLALFRVSASAPSPEQIKKIYEDEKVLFQENAACTLYGASDAVTALAYDDTTKLL